MKRLTFTLVMLFVACVAFAQNSNLQSSEIGGVFTSTHENVAAKTPTDTVFIDDFFANLVNAYNYLAPGTGYIFGPHWDTAGVARSVEQAQGYWNLTSGFGIEAILFWTSIKNKTSVDGANLYVKLCLIDGTSSYTIGGDSYDIDCPGTVLATDTILYADIDTSGAGWTAALFDPPVYIPASTEYAVVYNVSDFYAKGDTLSIIGGDPVAATVYGLEYTWYKYPNPVLWTQFSHIWTSGGLPIEAAIAIFPVIDDNYINVGDNSYFNHLQLSQNCPNPSNGTTTIQYALETEGNVYLEVYDAKGTRMILMEEGFKTAGTYTIHLTHNLPAGVYYYSLVADDMRLTKSMVVE